MSPTSLKRCISWNMRNNKEVQAVNAAEIVNRLKLRLANIYSRYGKLTHPEVVKASQELDRAIVELIRQKATRISKKRHIDS